MNCVARHLLAGALVLAALPACATTGGGPGDGVEARLLELIRLSEQRDADGTTAIHRADAVLVPPTGDFVVGRDAIHAFTGLPSDAEVGNTEIETVRLVEHDDVAYHTGRYTYRVTGAASETTVRGRFLMVWERADGEWQLAADMWSVDD